MKRLLWLLPLVLLLLFFTRQKTYDGPKYTADLTAERFAADVEEAEGWIAVDFWASWCGPCRKIEATIEQLASHYEGRMRIGKLNVDDHPSVAEKYRVAGIPTLILFHNGQVIDRRSGAFSEVEYRAWFDELLVE